MGADTMSREPVDFFRIENACNILYGGNVWAGMHADEKREIRAKLAAALEGKPQAASSTQAAEFEFVGETINFPLENAHGITMACFQAEAIPAGTSLFRRLASSTTPASGAIEDVHGNAVKIDGEWMDYRDTATRAPGVDDADLAELAYWRREHADDLHHRRYGDGTTHAQRIAEHREAALTAAQEGAK